MKRVITICLLLGITLTVNAQKVFENNGKFGIKDSIGKVITKAKYEKIEDFSADITVFKLKGKYGIINSKGKEVTEPIYQEIKPISFFSDNVDVKQEGKWGVLDLKGNVVVTPKYADPVEIFSFVDYSVVSTVKSIVISSGIANKKYGVIENATFKEIISPKYSYLADKDFGYFKVSMSDENRKYGLIDKDEKFIFEIKYDDIFALSKDIISIKKNKKWSLLNSKGYSISSVEYDNIFKLFENRAKVMRNGKFGYIDEKGKEVIPCKYDDADVIFRGGKVKVKLDDLKFEIDSNGNEVTVSKTLKPRNTLIFIDKNDEKAFDLINFKDNVDSVENLKLVDNYLATSKNYDIVIASIDNLMSEASNNKSAYKIFANYLYAKYSKSQFACFDAVPIHVSQKYMCNSDAPYGGGYWLGKENKKEICDFANKYKPSLCGQIIPDISLKLLPQTNSNYLKLNNVKSKYTLLFFWKNECSPCDKYIQVLNANYPALQNLGVEIIGITTDLKALDRTEQLIVSNNINWTNVVDLNSTFSQKLNVVSVPQLFLLDKEKKIIIKTIGAEQLIDYLKRINN